MREQKCVWGARFDMSARAMRRLIRQKADHCSMEKVGRRQAGRLWKTKNCDEVGNAYTDPVEALPDLDHRGPVDGSPPHTCSLPRRLGGRMWSHIECMPYLIWMYSRPNE